MAVMYRRVIFSLFPRRPALTPSPEPTCTPPLRAHIALRAVVQVSCRAFGSTGVVLCEKKDSTSSPPSKKVKNNEKTSKSWRAKTTEPKQRTDHKTEPNSGKKALRDLLGTMRVELTTKQSPSKKQLSVEKPPSRPKEIKSTTSKATVHSKSLNEDLIVAAAAAAAMLPDSSQAKSELLQQLRKHHNLSPPKKKGDASDVQKIITEMAVSKRQSVRPKGNSAIRVLYDTDDQEDPIAVQLDRFSSLKSLKAHRLNIFPTGKEQETDADLAAGPSLWDTDLASEIAKLLNTHPRNGFEEMIQWTREGRMWQYPIDNEAGMDEEASVPFHEHVFLERHLEDGFPKQGPVRHFMELVVTGLSKNHQLSVQQKLEHIAWFRDYFQQKQEILKEAEAY